MKTISVWCHDKEGNLITNSQNVIVRSIENKKKFHHFLLKKAELLQLVSKRLVWILRIDENNVVIYFRMVHTRQGARIELPCLERRSRGWNAQDWHDEDPLDDTASHASARASGSLCGRTTRVEEERVPNRIEKIPPTEMGQQEKAKAHPSTVLTGGASAMYTPSTISLYC
jgi:hypothetical protein